MMKVSNAWKSLALLSSTAGLTLAPAPDGATGAIGVSDACATGTCCREVGSLCGINGNDVFVDNYYKTTGSCQGS